jgi:hypothetical protein
MSAKLEHIQVSCMQEWHQLQHIAKQQATTISPTSLCPTNLASHLRTISWTPVTGGD